MLIALLWFILIVVIGIIQWRQVSENADMFLQTFRDEGKI